MSLLVRSVKTASSWQEKCIGLLNQPDTTSLYFKTRWGIHTFGMQYPLTIIVCDDTFRVKVLHHIVKPYNIVIWWPGWQHVFELPAGKYDIRVGDKLVLREQLL